MNNSMLRFSQLATLVGLKRHTLNARATSMFSKEELTRNTGKQILLNPSQIRQLITDRLCQIDNKIIYIGNLKGGVGKTTIAFLLINTLASLGFKVCAIDLDVQSNLTRQFINIDAKQPVFFDVVEGTKNIQDIIIKLSPNLDFIPSSLRNSLLQKSLSLQSPKHHLTWFNSLCLDHLRSQYEIIVVDTPPNLTTLNSVFCLCLKDNDHIIIPACAEDFSIMGIDMFLDDISCIRNSYSIASNPKISIIINRFFQNQKTNLEMLVKIGKKYDGVLSEIIIRDSAQIREIINNKIKIGDIKQGKDIYEIITSLLSEFNILKKTAS